MNEMNKIIRLKEKLHRQISNLDTLITNDHKIIGKAIADGRPSDDESVQIAIARVKGREAERATLNDVIDSINAL